MGEEEQRAGTPMADPATGADEGLPSPSPEKKVASEDDVEMPRFVSSGERLLCPPSHLPQPKAPPGLDPYLVEPNRSLSDSTPPMIADIGGALGKVIRDRGSIFTSAIAKRINSFRESDQNSVAEFRLSGLKVIVRGKEDAGIETFEIARMPIVSFFSRSNCRDCGAVRSFFRERGLLFTEINLDVFPEREEEFRRLTGTARPSVPMIFLRGRLLGGLVALNSLRNSGEFERRLAQISEKDEVPAAMQPPPPPPRVPAMDSLVEVARAMRERVVIRDRISKMKLVKSCFTGSAMVDALIHYLDCGRKKAAEVGGQLAKKNFIHHVFRETEFMDESNQFYRFMEHDPIIPRSYNFAGSTNDFEPKPASEVGRTMMKVMSAILEAYASHDRSHLDYRRICRSEEFRRLEIHINCYNYMRNAMFYYLDYKFSLCRYLYIIQDLQRLDIFTLATDEKTAFFMNLYNSMVIHAVIVLGPPTLLDCRAVFTDFHYIVGGFAYSPSIIRNGILRLNRRPPLSMMRPFAATDKRLELMLPKMNPLIHFGLCDATRSSPSVRFFSPQGIEAELRNAARDFFAFGGLEVDLEKRTVFLTRIIKWYASDFGHEKEILKWVLSFLDASRAGLLTHLLNDGGPINIVYQNFNRSLNTSKDSSKCKEKQQIF